MPREPPQRYLKEKSQCNPSMKIPSPAARMIFMCLSDIRMTKFSHLRATWTYVRHMCCLDWETPKRNEISQSIHKIVTNANGVRVDVFLHESVDIVYTTSKWMPQYCWKRENWYPTLNSTATYFYKIGPKSIYAYRSADSEIKYGTNLWLLSHVRNYESSFIYTWHCRQPFATARIYVLNLTT